MAGRDQKQGEKGRRSEGQLLLDEADVTRKERDRILQEENVTRREAEHRTLG
ncbi:MAG: hypothetical protein WED00_15305 [Aquisalimonadaceae bacterium]